MRPGEGGGWGAEGEEPILGWALRTPLGREEEERVGTEGSACVE